MSEEKSTNSQNIEELPENPDDEMVYFGDLTDEVIDDLENALGAEEPLSDEEGAENVHEEEERELPERDDSILTFAKHEGPIFCASLHPSENLAVTGGEDDKAYVWNTATGEVVFAVPDHNDSVIAAGFSHDGIFLATGDMAGEIQVFKTTKDYEKVWSFSMGDMCWMKWHSAGHVLLAGADSGEIYVWRIPSGDCKVLQGYGEKCETATLTEDGKKLAAGYGDGMFKLWDLKAGTAIIEMPPTENATGHSETITTISCDRENHLILTGSEDGKATLLTPNGPVGVLNGNSGAIESVLLDCPDLDAKIAVTATLDGKVTIWDASKQIARTECEDPNPVGITRMVWAKDHAIVAGSLSGAIKVWDARTGQLRFTLLGHADNINDVCYDKKRNIVLSASEDGTAKIFNYSSPV
ncbi:angio-associated migratory cell protein-like [Culicoides brevitarsis]|uniref:angio-associated migratory cell protein-like n=1 Tax=Culicoides brevitarsis TaxID=469753 RepID=UPI00307BB2A2